MDAALLDLLVCPVTHSKLRLEGDELIATAMVGDDGHRAWVYYLAVQPALVAAVNRTPWAARASSCGVRWSVRP